MMDNLPSYEIIIKKGNFENGDCFEARVRELPDLLAHAETYEDAYLEIQDLIEVTAESCAEDGKVIPKHLPTGESDG